MGQGAVVYDTETYPNCFLLGAVDLYSGARVMFELSDRRSDSEELLNFLRAVQSSGALMIGFNNLNFDYPIIHDLMSKPALASYAVAYDKAQSIIGGGDRWGHQIWASDRFTKQLDLFRMNHFDNPAKSTSLKLLQFTMREQSVEDLPYPPGTFLTSDEIDVTRSYCDHDLDATKRFAIYCWPEIAFRYSMVDRFGEEVLNWSDVKIGGEYLIKELGWETCYTRDSAGKRVARQTQRDSISVADIVLPYVKFQSRECRDLLDYMKSKTIWDTRAGVNASVTMDGFRFDLGTGGIHGSQTRRKFHSSGPWVIIDADVTSLYPSIAIENGLAPEHLGAKFVQKYGELRAERKKHPKKTPINAALKLALNGTYGMSNNPWSPFYDPKFTMAITINGQLLLLMLAESLLTVPTLELIQINTDGVTFRVHEQYEEAAMELCRQWQLLTKLSLEFAEYQSFFCRDVNNYIAVDVDGKMKRKGAYDYPEKMEDYLGWWHRDYSALAIQKAAVEFLVRGVTIRNYLEEMTDPFDFMLRVKCPRSSTVQWQGQNGPERQQRITRYYASTDGGLLWKESPPVPGATPGEFKRGTNVSDQDFYRVSQEIGPGVWDSRIHTKNKSVYDDRVMKVHPRASICNNASHFSFDNLDLDWYASEAHKLTDVFK